MLIVWVLVLLFYAVGAITSISAVKLQDDINQGEAPDSSPTMKPNDFIWIGLLWPFFTPLTARIVFLLVERYWGV